MKKLLLLFILLPFLGLAQNPTTFPYGIKNTVSTQNTTPTYFVTQETDGIHKKTPTSYFIKNQNTSAQNAEIWINKDISFGSLASGSIITPIDRKLKVFNYFNTESGYINFQDRSSITNSTKFIVGIKDNSNLLFNAFSIDGLSGGIATFSNSVTSGGEISAVTRFRVNPLTQTNQLLGDGTAFSIGGANNFGIRNDSGNVFLAAGGNVPQFTLATTGAATFSSLAGTGTRTVVADASGVLSTSTSVGSRPYKVYTALISQFGTGEPTAIVLENSLGGTVGFNRITTGSYNGTLVAAFTSGKTTVTINNGNITNYILVGFRESINSFAFYSSLGGTLTDNGISNATLEIRVYN